MVSVPWWRTAWGRAWLLVMACFVPWDLSGKSMPWWLTLATLGALVTWGVGQGFVRAARNDPDRPPGGWLRATRKPKDGERPVGPPPPPPTPGVGRPETRRPPAKPADAAKAATPGLARVVTDEHGRAKADPPSGTVPQGPQWPRNVLACLYTGCTYTENDMLGMHYCPVHKTLLCVVPVKPAYAERLAETMTKLEEDSERYAKELPLCPVCKKGTYVSKSPGGTERWSCGHTIGK